MPAEKALHRQRLTRDLGAVFPGINIILDQEALLQAARHSRPLITVEEHSVYGGLGEACAAILMHHGIVPLLKIVGIPDECTMPGSQAQTFEHYGITPEGLAATSRKLLQD